MDMLRLCDRILSDKVSQHTALKGVSPLWERRLARICVHARITQIYQESRAKPWPHRRAPSFMGPRWFTRRRIGAQNQPTQSYKRLALHPYKLKFAKCVLRNLDFDRHKRPDARSFCLCVSDWNSLKWNRQVQRKCGATIQIKFLVDFRFYMNNLNQDIITKKCVLH